MRLLATGGGGQLGRAVEAAGLGGGHEVRIVTRSVCDIAEAAQVAAVLDDARPDVVINCAAWTAVDAAEREVDAACRANAVGPRVLATEAASRDILLIHLSTDYVFDGSADKPMDESRPPAPRSVYGSTKLAGEDAVRAAAGRHAVVRTSWLYGWDGPNFPLTMLRAAAQGRQLRVVADQVGTPTWTGHLAPALVRLAELGATGTYHLTNSGLTTWHGLAEEVFAAAGLEVSVAPISTAEYPTPAPRPAYSVLDNRAWRELGEAPLPDWREGVRRYVAELRERGRLPVAASDAGGAS